MHPYTKLRRARAGFYVFVIASLLINSTAGFAPLRVFSAPPPNPSVDLDQCKNGGDIGTNPIDPCEWSNQNLNENHAHYTEGQSVGYRAVIKDLTTGAIEHFLVIEYDIKHSDKHAIDYLTAYDRIAETVDPCDGEPTCVPGTGGDIPAPSSSGSPVSGQPTNSFNALETAEGNQQIAIFNGNITSVTYPIAQGDLTASQSETMVQIGFTANNSRVVIAWGGHIASSIDWGVGNSAVGINGAPYHMRVIAIDDHGGNQDRSLAAGAVTPVPDTTLTVQKIVTNDNGGTKVVADFPLFIDATPVTSGTVNTVEPGSYVVSETADASYTASDWAGDCDASGNVTLAEGDNKTCTITNNDNAAHLIVVKNVINDDGGTAVASDFTMTINDVTASGGNSFAGSELGTDKTLTSVGSYSVGETGPTGYIAVYSSDCTGTIALGETLTCTITNSDIAPKLTVTKVVENNDGGTLEASNFPLFVNGSPVTSGVQNTYTVGSYTVSETGQNGYVGTISGDCAPDGSITLNPGDVKSCTITNDDVAPGLTVVKIVTNDNGGDLEAADFILYVDETEVTSGESNDFPADDYVVSEDPVSGYTGTISGDCNSEGEVTLGLGETKICYITNDDIAPTLTLVKTVQNDNGGTKAVSDFTLKIDGTTVTSGVATALEAGAHTAAEVSVAGYAASEWGGDCATDGSVDLSVGDEKTCTITNDDIQPLLTVTKIVINNSETGTSTASDFTLKVGGTEVLNGVQNGFDADSYLITESGPSGYTGTASGDCDTAGNVTLEVGDVKECTITNDDNDPTEGTLTVTKAVINDDETGSSEISDFTLKVGETVVTSGAANSFTAGDYTVTETGPTGYTATFTGDCDENGDITIVAGETYECTITNNDIPEEVIDVCPNLEGTQESLPEGYELVEGQCVLPPTDVCPNIEGTQTSVPSGKVLSNGNCVDEPTPPPPPPPPPPSGGGGGGGFQGLSVFNETNVTVGSPDTTISWFTNISATCTALYGDESQDNVGIPPNYDYDSTAAGATSNGTFHTATLTGIQVGTTYYWRPVCTSTSTAETKLGQQLTFALGPVVLGIEAPVEENVKVLGFEVLPKTGGVGAGYYGIISSMFATVMSGLYVTYRRRSRRA